MKNHFLNAGVSILGILLLGLLAPHSLPSRWDGKSPGGPPQPEMNGMKEAGKAPDAAVSPHLPHANSTAMNLPSRPLSHLEILALLDRTMANLQAGEPAAVKAALAQLDEAFAGDHHDAAAGIAAILDFLKSGADAPTGEGFLVGEGGILTEATSLRVFLMDQLGTLSREAGSPAALEVARENLQRPASADEWALSLRNVAWFDPQDRAYLADRVRVMLEHEPWRQNPTQGMMEAFDLIVFSGALTTLPELSRLITTEGSPLERAAGVALDRLAATRALELTTMLNRQPELFAATPLQRADLFAHVDLGNAAQLVQAEAYLLRPDVTAAEREKFLGALLQSGQFVSHNLVTPYTPPETPAAASSRLDLLSDTLSGWITDARFTGLRSELIQLGTNVNQIHDEISADLAGNTK